MIGLQNELNLEYTCMYVRHFNKIISSVNKKEFDEKKKLDMQGDIKDERSQKTAQLCEKHKIDSVALNNWFSKNKKLEIVQKNAKMLA